MNIVEKIENMTLPEKCANRARIVFSKNDLLEKICIFESMLNDVLIELIKPFVISKVEEDGISENAAERIYFSNYENGKITFSFPEIENNYKVDIPVQLYEELWRRNKIKEINGFRVVDKNNAATYLER